MTTYTGIDKGLNFSNSAPGNECYTGQTIRYCYNKKRNAIYKNRAASSTYSFPLTGGYAELANAEFTEFVLKYAQDGIKNGFVAKKFETFLTYWLGKIDAGLISSYLASGKSWSTKSFGADRYDVPEMWNGQVNKDLGVFTDSPDRRVEAAIKHASVVFQNVPNVMIFINTQGDFKATKVKVAKNQKERNDQIDAVNKLKKGLEKGLELPGKVGSILPIVIGIAALIIVTRK